MTSVLSNAFFLIEDVNSSFNAPSMDDSIPLRKKTDLIRTVMEQSKRKTLRDISAFSIKSIFKLMFLSMGIKIQNG